MNLPLSQQGLNTHRVNIPGLNPGWVDIGLVWVQDFIFLPLTLVFAGSDLNSIGVICLSKARTGTCRSWVCLHCEQGNSIRRCPFCVWGVWLISGYRRIKVGWVHIRGAQQFQGKEFTMAEEKHHRWRLLWMNCLHIQATSQKQTEVFYFLARIIFQTDGSGVITVTSGSQRFLSKTLTMQWSADKLSSGGGKTSRRQVKVSEMSLEINRLLKCKQNRVISLHSSFSGFWNL